MFLRIVNLTRDFEKLRIKQSVKWTFTDDFGASKCGGSFFTFGRMLSFNTGPIIQLKAYLAETLERTVIILAALGIDTRVGTISAFVNVSANASWRLFKAIKALANVTTLNVHART